MNDYKVTSTAITVAIHPLTFRELQVIQGIVLGKVNKEIAEELGLGVRTIETHRQRCMHKLQIFSVGGLTCWALVKGLIKIEGSDFTLPNSNIKQIIISGTALQVVTQ